MTTSTTGDEVLGERAVVIGGGFGGLFAADVLQRHFRSVTIVDRDTFPESPTTRSGVAQDGHPHLLLPPVWAHIAEEFPSVYSEIKDERGAPEIRGPNDLAVVRPQGVFRREPLQSDYSMLGCRRTLVETSLRREIGRKSSVSFLEHKDVVGLTLDDDGDVDGVRYRERGPDRSEQVHELGAELVVDASGRHSDLEQWLEEHQLPVPRRETVDGGVGYATLWCRQPRDYEWDWKTLITFPEPPDLSRGNLLFCVDGDEMAIVLSGWNEDYPPIDREGMVEWSKSLSNRVVHDFLRIAEPIEKPHGYRQASNDRWRFDEIDDPPGGFVVVGDAHTNVNPVFGMGVCLAMFHAEYLDDLLEDLAAPPGSADVRRYFGNLYRKLDPRWSIPTLEDLRFSGTDVRNWDKDPTKVRLLQRYFDWVSTAAAVDSRIARSFFEVLTAIRPVDRLFKPPDLFRILGAKLRAAMGGGRRADLASLRPTKNGAFVDDILKDR